MNETRYDPAEMVGWYDPRQLLETAQQVAISSIFGRYSDHRLLEALEPESGDWADLSVNESGQPRGELWLHYVADTGDGWSSTYAVAYWLAQPWDRLGSNPQ